MPCLLSQTRIIYIPGWLYQFEDIKVVIRSRKTNDRQYKVKWRKDKQRSSKLNTRKLNTEGTKTRCVLGCSALIRISCSTSDTCLITRIIHPVTRKVWRYQRGNQKGWIEEYNDGANYDLQSNTNKTDWATRTTLITRVNSWLIYGFYSPSGTRRAISFANRS